MRGRKNEGVSLTEVLAVVAIVGVLAALASPVIRLLLFGPKPDHESELLVQLHGAEVNTYTLERIEVRRDRHGDITGRDLFLVSQGGQKPLLVTQEVRKLDDNVFGFTPHLGNPQEGDAFTLEHDSDVGTFHLMRADAASTSEELP